MSNGKKKTAGGHPSRRAFADLATTGKDTVKKRKMRSGFKGIMPRPVAANNNPAVRSGARRSK